MRKWLFVLFGLITSLARAQDSTVTILKNEANRTIAIAVPDSIKNKKPGLKAAFLI